MRPRLARHFLDAPTQEIVRDLLRRSVFPVRSPDKRSLDLHQRRPQSITLVTCFRHAGFVTEGGGEASLVRYFSLPWAAWGREDSPSGNGQCVGVESSEVLGPLMEVIVPLLDPPWNWAAALVLVALDPTWLNRSRSTQWPDPSRSSYLDGRMKPAVGIFRDVQGGRPPSVAGTKNVIALRSGGDGKRKVEVVCHQTRNTCRGEHWTGIRLSTKRGPGRGISRLR